MLVSLTIFILSQLEKCEAQDGEYNDLDVVIGAPLGFFIGSMCLVFTLLVAMCCYIYRRKRMAQYQSGLYPHQRANHSESYRMPSPILSHRIHSSYDAPRVLYSAQGENEPALHQRGINQSENHTFIPLSARVSYCTQNTENEHRPYRGANQYSQTPSHTVHGSRDTPRILYSAQGENQPALHHRGTNQSENHTFVPLSARVSYSTQNETESTQRHLGATGNSENHSAVPLSARVLSPARDESEQNTSQMNSNTVTPSEPVSLPEATLHIGDDAPPAYEEALRMMAADVATVIHACS